MVKSDQRGSGKLSEQGKGSYKPTLKKKEVTVKWCNIVRWTDQTSQEVTATIIREEQRTQQKTLNERWAFEKPARRTMDDWLISTNAYWILINFDDDHFNCCYYQIFEDHEILIDLILRL